LPESRFPKMEPVTRSQIAWTMMRIKSLQAYHSLVGTPSLLEVESELKINDEL
jgi:hypothetical protein